MEVWTIEEIPTEAEVEKEIILEEDQERHQEEVQERYLEVDMKEMEHRSTMEDRRRKIIEDIGIEHQVVIDTEEDLEAQKIEDQVE